MWTTELLNKLKADIKDGRTLMFDDWEELPDDIGESKRTEVLFIDECPMLLSLPSTIGLLHNLMELRIHYCDSIVSIPPEVGSLHNLRKIFVFCCNAFETLPPTIGQLQSLNLLELEALDNLSTIPTELGDMPSLETLRIKKCRRLEALPSSIGKLRSLKELGISGCENLAFPNDLLHLVQLEALEMFSCPEMTASWVRNLSNLKKVTINDFGRGSSAIAELGNLPKMRELELYKCADLEIPNWIGQLRNLERLKIKRCDNFTCLPHNLGNLRRLQYILLDECKDLKGLPARIGDLASLQTLEILNCYEITEIPPEMGQLTNLREICMAHCGIVKWEQLLESTLPRRLQVLKWNDSALPIHPDERGPRDLWLPRQLEELRWNDSYLPLNLDVHEVVLSKLLAKNTYLKRLGGNSLPSRLDNVLALNFFRPVLPGGHLTVKRSELPFFMEHMNERLASKTCTNATALYTILRSQLLGDGSGVGASQQARKRQRRS